jgi:hypothetical protein
LSGQPRRRWKVRGETHNTKEVFSLVFENLFDTTDDHTRENAAARRT